jgi:replication-associated recombination protein RarA
MVGLKNVKEQIMDQILFFLQGGNNCGSTNCYDCTHKLPCVKGQQDMLHTVITGTPGVGKTEVGKILGSIYKAMGILSVGHFTVVSRADLVGEYLGQTTIKTKNMIKSCKGGVMFIDEAYALGNKEQRDSFSKECIDALNQSMSEERDFMCIIAGYKDELENCFFKYNEGLRRRFTFRYDLVSYSSDELKEIFELKVKAAGYTLDNTNEDNCKEITAIFKKNKKYFPNNGGDIETLFLNCRIMHCRNIIKNKGKRKFIISIDDIIKGMSRYIKNRNYKENMEDGVNGSLYV